MGWNKLGNCPMANSVSPPLTFRLKVICWESLTHSMWSEFFFPYNISSKEFQGQCTERSQPLMSSNQINSEFWQQYIRQESFTSRYSAWQTIERGIVLTFRQSCDHDMMWHFWKVMLFKCSVPPRPCATVGRVYIAVAVITFTVIFSFLKAQTRMFRTHNYWFIKA